MRLLSTVGAIAALVGSTLACDSCYGRSEPNAHVRQVKRMQPSAPNATSLPRSPLAWGQLNFLHTTDTHGWLEGHIKEKNYGADWGDYKSFVRRMRQKAERLDVDLLIVDTGDLHDGNGDSDAESPDGSLTNPIFEQVDFDVLTIGNHELYISDIAYLTADSFAKYYGGKYVSSNVQIFNNQTGQYQNIANQYRYFTTKHGIRIMAFGVLYDFTGNSNASKVTKAADMIQQPWFATAVNYTKPIDLFLLIGHNPLRTSSGSTLTTVQAAIRASRPDVPIQLFGGHSHVRDFAVYDEGATGLESGRYCETLGFLSMSGIKAPKYRGVENPAGVPNPSMKATVVSSTVSAPKTTTTLITREAAATTSVSGYSAPSSSGLDPFADLVYFRRYLDWNRLTFAYHAKGSQSKTFDTKKGEQVSASISSLRTELNLTKLYGCAPQTWCLSCAPFGSSGNIFTLLETALAATVVNKSRANIPRIILINTGGIRFDLVEGPFTFDDGFIVSPFRDGFQFFSEVPWANAKQILSITNTAAFSKRDAEPKSIPETLDWEARDISPRNLGFGPLTGGDNCVDASLHAHSEMLARRDANAKYRTNKQLKTRGLVTRQNLTLAPGYTTTDDFGSDGDDTIHSPIPHYPQPNNIQANASLPTDGSDPTAVDVIFLDYIATSDIIPALAMTGLNYTVSQVQQYLDPSFSTNTYLPAYAMMAPAWQLNVPNCPVG